MPKVLVIQVAGLGWGLWERARERMPALAALAAAGRERPLRPPFPAVTVTAQATFATGAPPAEHGMVANGLYHRDLMKAMFWEQSAGLVQGEPIWRALKERKPDATTAMLFWQNSIGSGNDIVLTPAPIHKHGHGMINSCYGVPGDLYDTLAIVLGEFRLRWYWGPFVSIKGTHWIVAATIEVLREYTPDLLLTYVPHLDYEQQRLGPDHPKVLDDAAAVDEMLGTLIGVARENGYAVLVWGDYAIEPVDRFVSPNRLLREAGLLNVREVAGREYLDPGTSAAFAMVDHQVAHVYAEKGSGVVCAKHPKGLQANDSRPLFRQWRERIRDAFEPHGNDLSIIDPAERGLAHARCGEVVLEAAEGCWFDYRWWRPGAAPDFAGHVDIHNKPGFDPCELFRERWGLRTGTDPARVRGSHGRQAPAVVLADECIPLPAGDAVPLTELKARVVDSLTGRSAD